MCCDIVLWHWSDQHLLTLILVLGCCSKFSVGRIQTRHTDFLIPQAWGKLWQGWLLCMNTINQQLISYDKKVGEGDINWHCTDHRSLIIKLFLVCFRKLSVGRTQTGYSKLLIPQVCKRSCLWLRLVVCTWKGDIGWGRGSGVGGVE